MFIRAGVTNRVSPLNFENVLIFSTPTAGNGLKLTVPTTPYKTYTVTFDYARVTGSVTSMTVQATSASTMTISSASVTAQTYVFTAGAGTSTDILFKLFGSGTKTAWIDNIKITYETQITGISDLLSQGYRFGFNGQEKDDEV